MTEQHTTAKTESPPPEHSERTTDARVFRPHVDILDGEDAVLLIADMPGVDESSTDISLENNLLTIRGEVKPTEVPGHELVYAEYAQGNYERTFTLSAEIDRTKIEATIKDGVLRLTLPKQKEAQVQKIAITAG